MKLFFFQFFFVITISGNSLAIKYNISINDFSFYENISKQQIDIKTSITSIHEKFGTPLKKEEKHFSDQSQIIMIGEQYKDFSLFYFSIFDTPATIEITSPVFQTRNGIMIGLSIDTIKKKIGNEKKIYFYPDGLEAYYFSYFSKKTGPGEIYTVIFYVVDGIVRKISINDDTQMN